MNRIRFLCFFFSLFCLTAHSSDVYIKRQGNHCGQDPNCFNRIHPDIPLSVEAKAGDSIVFETRNSLDVNIKPGAKADQRLVKARGSTVHPITGPVYILGAKAGDTLAVSIENVEPGQWGFTQILPFGFISDLFPKKPVRAIWKLGKDYAETDFIPGIRIPFSGFPGIIMTLPDKELAASILKRETALLDSGGEVSSPETANAYPPDLCSHMAQQTLACFRTIPPREHGGNLDIRYLGEGATVYLPCYQDGCGLAIGDVHYAQGDGEVSGTAIEMDAKVTVKTRIIPKGLKKSGSGIAYEGPASLMDIPSSRFYATTGIPVKDTGLVPPDMLYLESEKVAELSNLSKDISLASRNALIAMLDYLVNERGFSREQAYIIMSVAVDLRIGQLVDAPNVNVSAILPLDIFVDN